MNLGELILNGQAVRASKGRRKSLALTARGKGIYFMDDEERAAVEEGLEQARRGEFVPDDEMKAFWKRLGVL
jgi:predicted transcriptional regulator